MTSTDGRKVLEDVDPALWGVLLGAVRRAADSLVGAQLPSGLRPYARFTPAALAAPRPRAAVAAALAGDGRLRQAVGAELDAGLWSDASEQDARRLAADHGDAEAIASLAARARWDDVAVVAAAAAERRRSQARASSEVTAPMRRDPEVADARRERDEARRRAEAAEVAARRLREELAAATASLHRLQAEVARLRAAAEEDGARADKRIARLRRRLADAQNQGVGLVDGAHLARAAEALGALAAELRGYLAAPPGLSGEGPFTDLPEALPDLGASAVPPVPRSVVAASAGRPCRLPGGVLPDTSEAVLALVQVRDLVVLLDGYNVTKDIRGVPLAPLPEQRAWLLAQANRVVARWRRDVVAVFDGTDPVLGTTRSPRGVRLLFTAGEESADERIVTIVEDLAGTRPVLVVTSDRAVRDACTALGADVATSTAFLAALGRYA